MALRPVEITPLRRDGTSQAARVLDALDPGGVAIDGHTTGDLLAFIRAYASNLIYYDQRDAPAGVWDGFFADLTDDVILEFLDRPQDFEGGRYGSLNRPHFVLFLA